MIVGYRTLESSFNSIVAPFEDVLEYETLELGNVDIYMTMRELYNIKLDLRWKRQKCNEIVMQFLRNKYRCTGIHCVWLCDDIQDVKRLYARNGEEIIRVYLPDNALLVSNLGPDGKLYTIHSCQTYSYEKVI